MPAPPTPWRRAIDQVLADDAWHTLDDLVARCGHHVPPQRAHRERERYRARQGGPARLPMTDDSVRTGRRALIRKALLEGATIERRTSPAGVAEYRRRPQ